MNPMTTSSAKYGFPFIAYDIQEQLMDALIHVLDNNKVAIIESPTGTGKSLSIICAALHWIQHNEDNQLIDCTQRLQSLNEEIDRLDAQIKVSDHWIQLQHSKTTLCQQKETIDKQLKAFNMKKERNQCLIDKRNNSFVKQKVDLINKSVTKKLKTSSNTTQDLINSLSDNDVEDNLIVDYNSDDEVVDNKDKTDEEENYIRPKIYYCSRTHSQLSQFISEIKKTIYSRQQRPVRSVPLSSRSNYCINNSVSRLSNNSLINEKCIELQNSNNSQMKCQFLKNTLINEFKDEVLADVMDIEDITKLGKGVKACPYYSTRMAIPEAELVILPYNILLHSATRESFGINLKDSVVIVDEAHNLMETIYNIHSIDIKGSHVLDCLTQLNSYLTKYRTRLSAKNTMYIKQIVFILNQLIKHFKKCSQNTSQNVDNSVNFMISVGIENLNLYKILDYCQKSRIARKLFGFNENHKKFIKPENTDEVDKQPINGTKAFLAKIKAKGKSINVKTINTSNTNDQNNEEIKTFGSPLYVIQEFLRALITTNSNAKVITNCDKESIRNSSLKYIILNPFTHLKDIINECRSVVLCGGTMKPFEEYIDHLFKPLGVPLDRIFTFSCGHVIPDSNLVTIALGMGPNNRQLNYTFQNRNNNELIEETGRTVANLCTVIPNGLICFFPSYDFQDLYYNVWQKLGILKTIESKGKTLFREPKKASFVSKVLSDYNLAIIGSNKKGALLMCVVGGKMSEGINFSDHLGRGVIVVGLPYANKNSIELKEKINYFNSFKANSGNEFYENLCLKAVNQSIGRAIRHKNDFAVIVLLDSRYRYKENIKQGLPDWISSRIISCDNFAKALSSAKQFFQNK
ncbi:ATP-dependent DNA helicase DDX11-like [Oppia nitens]|uniref:ATP-dependent DNA helicase DDX11-like n=1 Tax=Oppia nitens TaxID=1686743 RepID=UPI0023D9A556|nr:ATP-dependent DNA helicase DDX11-like [Oppia nitens]